MAHTPRLRIATRESRLAMRQTEMVADALLGLTVNTPTQVTLPAGPAVLTVRSIRNPTQPELDRLLAPIKPPDFTADE